MWQTLKVCISALRPQSSAHWRISINNHGQYHTHTHTHTHHTHTHTHTHMPLTLSVLNSPVWSQHSPWLNSMRKFPLGQWSRLPEQNLWSVISSIQLFDLLQPVWERKNTTFHEFKQCVATIGELKTCGVGLQFQIQMSEYGARSREPWRSCVLSWVSSSERSGFKSKPNFIHRWDSWVSCSCTSGCRAGFL